MTPLAHYFAKQLTLPVKDRGKWRGHEGDLRRLLEDVHCFECTAAVPMAQEFSASLKAAPTDAADRYMGVLSFLPAPRTWIEWRASYGRVAMHLSAEHPYDPEKWLGAVLIFEEGISPLGLISRNSADVNFPGGRFACPAGLKHWVEQNRVDGTNVALSFLALAQMFLALINTPRIIGRRQHMPHVGLERELVRSFGRGKFPLHAWTEILLDVSKPTEIDDGLPHEAHLTGKRALHFCRAHLRIRLGKLEYVSSHWRGDAAIGIKQSRYKVTG